MAQAGTRLRQMNYGAAGAYAPSAASNPIIPVSQYSSQVIAKPKTEYDLGFAGVQKKGIILV